MRVAIRKRELALSGGSDPLAVETAGLSKSFGRVRALDGLDLAVPRGLVYGLLGPNGAGKTTAVRILATLLRPDGGTARVLGRDVVRQADAVRGLVSLTGQFASVDGDLTGRENLTLLARLLGYRRREARARVGELLEAFGLAPMADRPARTYSGGLRRRLDIAASLVVTPEVLFLDEPTTGLDPASRSEVWSLVRRLAARGTTVLLTTQYLDEADRLADRLAVLDGGAVIAEGTPGHLKASVGSGTLEVRVPDHDGRLRAARILERTLGSTPRGGAEPALLSVTLSEPERAAGAVAELARAGIAVTEFSLGRPSLDEVFLALTGRPAERTEAGREAA